MTETSMVEIRKKLLEMEKQIQRKCSDAVEETAASISSKSEKMNRSYSLCLGGGGGKGAYQIGVFQALYEYGLYKNIHAVSGASIGSLNGLLFIMGDPYTAEKCWKEINQLSLFEYDSDLIFNGVPGFASVDYMIQLVNKYIDFNHFYQSGIDLYLGVTEVATPKQVGANDRKRPLYIKANKLPKNEIETLLSASSAMPHIYEAVSYQGMSLVDGGVTDNIPVKPLYDSGSRHIILVGLNPEAKKNLSDYPDAEFLEIYPSVHLGDTLEGTLNFTKDAIHLRIKLGYRDAMRALKVYFEADPAYIKRLSFEQEHDLQEIYSEIRKEKLEEKIQGNTERLNNIITKYDK